MLKANQEFWQQQIKWNDAKKVQAKIIDLTGGS